eukprot:1357110-Amorphochlora_amoeboformis.AAC.1
MVLQLRHPFHLLKTTLPSGATLRLLAWQLPGDQKAEIEGLVGQGLRIRVRISVRVGVRLGGIPTSPLRRARAEMTVVLAGMLIPE